MQQNLLVARHPSAAPSLIRRLAADSGIIVAVLVGLEAYSRISPPLVLLAVVEVLFLLAWARLPAEA